ncbi:hypothetical protein ACFX11_008061 [Malus domestica]
MSISCTDSSTDLDDEDGERSDLSHKIWDLVASLTTPRTPNPLRNLTRPPSHSSEKSNTTAVTFLAPPSECLRQVLIRRSRMAPRCRHWYSRSRPPSMVAAQPQKVFHAMNMTPLILLTVGEILFALELIQS